MALTVHLRAHVVESPYAIAAPGRLPGQPNRRGHRPRPQGVVPLGSILSRPEKEHRRVSRREGLVLIVDDSLHTRELYMEYLKYRGLGVVTAPEAESGLSLARTLKPDVVIMDLAMPGLNGITATQRLKQDPRTRRIPVIVLTGYAFRAIEHGALEAGADVFLTKPCLPEDLEAKIRELLRPKGD
jgi:two-component system cell cycle response regulator DivK